MGYRLDESTGLINYDEAELLAQLYRPKLIIGGASAYTRHVDYGRLKEIAKKANAYLLSDMAHISGLVAAGKRPADPLCPIIHAHAYSLMTTCCAWCVACHAFKVSCPKTCSLSSQAIHLIHLIQHHMVTCAITGNTSSYDFESRRSSAAFTTSEESTEACHACQALLVSGG